MPDMLSSGFAWLSQQRHDHMTQEVAYRRGEAEVCVKATLGTAQIETEDNEVLLDAEWKDFLVRRVDIELFDKPKRGDKIIAKWSGLQRTFEVMSVPGQPVWRYSDMNGNTYRIHTKLVSTEVV